AKAALDSRIWMDRASAVVRLGKQRPMTDDIVAAIVRGLRDPHPSVREDAARTIAEIGPDANKAIPALLDLLGDTHDWPREYAAEALGKMGRLAVSSLSKRLDSDNRRVREAAAAALGQIGAPAQHCLPKLDELSKRDPCPLARKAAAQAVKRIRIEMRETR
ncbi:MAG: HEAT repeat domain-containing protein, partial [Actinomycetia bacterium]|nr:HEAT repeat domain-containing protein [Actinomycetes bacterium]